MFEKIQSIKNKKLLIKVLAGVLLLFFAFFFYLEKEKSTPNDITFISEELENSTTDSALELVDSKGDTSDMAEPAMIVVDVGGAVLNPSVVYVEEGCRIYEAIEKAGGLTTDADLRSINQAQFLTDGDKIYIPTKEEIEGGNDPSFLGYSSQAQNQNGSSNLISINTADALTLQKLSGVGPSTAEKIITYRNENGKFKTLEDLKNVSGIGDKTFEKLKVHITL